MDNMFFKYSIYVSILAFIFSYYVMNLSFPFISSSRVATILFNFSISSPFISKFVGAIDNPSVGSVDVVAHDEVVEII